MASKEETDGEMDWTAIGGAGFYDLLTKLEQDELCGGGMDELLACELPDFGHTAIDVIDLAKLEPLPPQQQQQLPRTPSPTRPPPPASPPDRRKGPRSYTYRHRWLQDEMVHVHTSDRGKVPFCMASELVMSKPKFDAMLKKFALSDGELELVREERRQSQNRENARK